MAEPPTLDLKYHQGLFRVTDQLRKLRTDPSQFSVEDYRSLLNELCGSLNNSLDGGLDRVINFASDLTQDEGIRKEAKAIVEDVEAFAKFISFEEEALIECGSSKESAKVIATEIASLREQIGSLPYDAGAVVETIKTGRDAICRTAKEIDSSLDKEIAHFEDAKRTMLTYGIAGSLANAAATAITAGAAFPFAALSYAGSGVLITLRGTLRDPSERRPGRR
jgi:hypothetical protein